MRIWVEAYYPDDTQILGNGDGQGVITTQNYRRTHYYKHLCGRAMPGWPLWWRPAYWLLVADGGTVIATLPNKYRKTL